MKSIIEIIESEYSEKRKVHTYGVRDTAVQLARKYGVDVQKAEIAALYHDLYRGKDIEEINSMIKKLNLPDKYIDNANLAHGKIAACVMLSDFKITDEDILNAVRYHTTGRANMSVLEKIIYLADAIEPNRKYPGVEELRKTAETDLDKACAICLQNSVDYVKCRGLYVDPDSIHALDYLKRSL